MATSPKYSSPFGANECPLVETLGRRHGSLDGQASNVLPALLEKRDKVVDGQHNVTDEVVFGHVDVADSDTHAENLLQLELDGGLDVGDLGAEILGVRDGGRELASCVVCQFVLCYWRRTMALPALTLGETRTQETRDLLDERVGSDEGIVLLSELLDELLVLVQLLQVVRGHGIDTKVLGTIDIVLVTEDAAANVSDHSKLYSCRCFVCTRWPCWGEGREEA